MDYTKKYMKIKSFKKEDTIPKGAIFLGIAEEREPKYVNMDSPSFAERIEIKVTVFYFLIEE